MAEPIPYKFNHVHFYCTNPEETERWLVDGVGAEFVKRGDIAGFPTTYLRLGAVNVYVRGAKPGEPLSPVGPYLFGSDHFGLEVEDLDATAAELKRRGVKFDVEPRVTEPGMRIAFIIGPDNARIELVELRGWEPH